MLIELPPGALPRDISANSMVVGELRSGGGFYWLPTKGVIYVGGQMAEAVSRDGDTIAGTAYDARNVTQAAIWQRAAEWRLLGSVVPNAVPCDALLSSTYDTSDDGKVIVGLAWNGCNFARAFRWEESTGMVDLGTLIAGRSTRANGDLRRWPRDRGMAGHGRRTPRRAMGRRHAGARSPGRAASSARPTRPIATARSWSGNRVSLPRSRIPSPISRRGSGRRATASRACSRRACGCSTTSSAPRWRPAKTAGSSAARTASASRPNR